MFEGLLQPLHLLLVLGVALLVFGPGRLPELGASLGKSIREFKKAFDPDDESLTDGRKDGGGRPQDPSP